MTVQNVKNNQPNFLFGQVTAPKRVTPQQGETRVAFKGEGIPGAKPSEGGSGLVGVNTNRGVGDVAFLPKQMGKSGTGRTLGFG